ncbi:NADPH-adrenodoxin reductase [Spizellomyces punctatus DAOM BR117]|uniref:NADPH:adrenodoxin oxidoreductase, mitochondrial n=1 Tax=Spizellomyces punctatus (strain DAOM BR117) TaxID=645134 RepID=A0A0L0HJB8_SPIPD|nr:NADPH-adrenodoxin reductase [Spizellomyces punctatus DAOM BR117]KND01113.1 hypothetical protein SPPG_04203 [Spizellomyces punctatus DAOM BR117]|eukprot:XP_016609152.1 hypothetical protein SPPG_04203 [Spizellomyces punctatus DAOM BR117]
MPVTRSVVASFKGRLVGAPPLSSLCTQAHFRFIRFYSASTHPPPASTEALTIGMVGSGPAGFYTAQHLLRNLPNVKIDMYEALPVPYGLVRFGVAPDHPEVKNVIHKFETIAQDPRFRFIGNVRIGHDLDLAELKPRYDALILSYGASQDQRLGLPDEDAIPNVFSARAFVGWYNGLPEHRDLNPDLESSDTAVVIGQGNVALDVARVLLMPLDELAKTDITEHALEALRRSKIRHVHLIGRRGPLQASFTAKELREMIALPDTKLHLDVPLLQSQMEAGSAILSKERPRRRLMELLLKGATNPLSNTSPTSKSWSLKFLSSPIHLVTNPTTQALEGLQLEKNRLEGPLNAPRAVGTGEIEEIPCGLLLRSIGYKSVPLQGLPFDSKRGMIPNVRGKVQNEDSFTSGIYVAGWLKRGPTGVIAATMYDAIETADTIINDIQKGELQPRIGPTVPPGFKGLESMLRARGVKVVDFHAWKKIDEVEVAEGTPKGKPREKVVEVDKMMEIAGR